ncbi:MAG: 6-bladed beta-propeller, partial [Candidatus Aminicenantes bacterium]|nr:6-bladed beta-propeller [Candidatus Aminicenantes bacterium]
MKTKYIRLLFLVFSFIVLSGESKAQSCKTIWSLSYFGDNDFFHMPSDIEVDKARSLIYITDSGNNRIVVFDFQGQFKKSFGSLGQGPGEFNRPTGLFIFENGCLAVADYENLRIQLFDQNNAFIETINTVNVRVADLIFTDNKYYTVSTYGASGYRLNQSEEKFQPLVTILDKEGKLTGEISVDDYPDTHPFIRAIKNRVCLTLSPDKKLFLPYFAINKIQIFD